MSLKDMIPDGHHLVLTGAGDQWTARIIPDNYMNEWSLPRPVQAKARTPEQAVEYAVSKCPVTTNS